jgi:magnesium transporter
MTIPRHGPVGSAPGTLLVDEAWPAPRLEVMAYGPEQVREARDPTPLEVAQLREEWPVVWLNVVGLGDADTLQELAEAFGVHRLALEDVVNLGHRAKVEPYRDQLFVVARFADTAEMRTSQVSLFLREGFLLTFEESESDCFDAVRERIRHAKGTIRTSGADYLGYALLDAAIDSYFPVIELLGEQLAELEDEVLETPDKTTAERIHGIKRSLIALRRAVWPHRELLSALQRDDFVLITAKTRVYLRDVYDHTT